MRVWPWHRMYFKPALRVRSKRSLKALASQPQFIPSKASVPAAQSQRTACSESGLWNPPTRSIQVEHSIGIVCFGIRHGGTPNFDGVSHNAKRLEYRTIDGEFRVAEIIDEQAFEFPAPPESARDPIFKHLQMIFDVSLAQPSTKS